MERAFRLAMQGKKPKERPQPPGTEPVTGKGNSTPPFNCGVDCPDNLLWFPFKGGLQPTCFDTFSRCKGSPWKREKRADLVASIALGRLSSSNLRLEPPKCGSFILGQLVLPQGEFVLACQLVQSFMLGRKSDLQTIDSTISAWGSQVPFHWAFVPLLASLPPKGNYRAPNETHVPSGHQLHVAFRHLDPKSHARII